MSDVTQILSQSNLSTRIFCAAALATNMMAVPAVAYVNVYGGPTYTSGVGGFKDGYATGVNNAGTAIGTAHKYDASGTDLGERAFRWDASASAATELGNLGTGVDGVTNSYVSAINNAGAIVGNAEMYDVSGESLGFRAIRWDPSNTVATELGHLGTDSSGVTYGEAFAINDAGTVVGYADKYDGSGGYLGDRAVRWAASSTSATELGNLNTDSSGVTYGGAYAINDAGTVVGNADKYDGSGVYLGNRAVRWNASGTVATELGNLGTDSSGVTYGAGYAINDAGTVVGDAYVYDGMGIYQGSRAVRWNASSTVLTELGNLGTDTSGYAQNYANDINDVGTVVGIADTYDGPEYLGFRAVRWGASSTMVTELGNLGTDPIGFTYSFAYAINDAGISVGYAADYDGSGTLLGERAVYWDLDGMVMDLNTLIDPASGWTLEHAIAISDTGWIAGHGTFDHDGPGEQEAYLRMFLMQVPALSVLPGDFNHDDVVDAADYVMWRKTDGSPAGYNTWRTNFGRTAGGGSASNATVPEPAAAVLLVLGAAIGFSRTMATFLARFKTHQV